MTFPLRNCTFVSGRWLAVMMLGCLGLISACSSEGTTTILDNGQSLTVDLPDQLFNAVDDGTLEAPNLRPVVTLSNGATVGTTLVDENRWSGTINVETGAVYTVTITWVERFLDQDLPLTRRTLDLAVGADGSTVEVEGSRTAYSDQGLDFDNDGATNLIERLSDTDPFEGVAVTNPDPDNEPVQGNIDVSPEVSVGLPDILLPALIDDAISINDLRPVVTVSNGDNEFTVDMTRLDNNEWVGTFNVTVAGVYQVEAIWVEDFQNQDLPLARRTFDLAIGEDSSVVQSAATGWDIDFDADNDGPSNLGEREDGTDPLVNNSDESVPTIITGTVTGNNQTTIISDSLPLTANVIVPRISASDAPEIDGLNVTANSNHRLTGEWEQAVQSDISGAILSIDNLIIDVDAEDAGDVPYRRWAAMHDGRYLYVVVLVDDNGQRVRDSGTELFDDDSLELYLDADNSDSSAYDENDFHRLFPLREPGDNRASKVSVNSGDVQGPNSSTAPLQIDFATGPGVGPDGLRRANFEQDVYELRIPLQPAGISTDTPFGFELQINDDDDGQSRDAKFGWMHSALYTTDIDGGLLMQSLMGKLMLE